MAFDSVDPETRLSLLIRLADAEDQAAWQEFVQLYHPVIYRTARCRGLQDADALDVSQQVLVSVGRALAQRPHDPQRARFRTWLRTLTRNAAINALRARTSCWVGENPPLQRHLETIAAASSEEEILEREYQKELFRQAARLVEPEFAPESWQAFWRTTIDQQPIALVAQQLGKHPGSVYAARSRIVRRLREEVERLRERDTE